MLSVAQRVMQVNTALSPTGIEHHEEHDCSQTLKSDEVKWSKLTRITAVGSFWGGGSTHDLRKSDEAMAYHFVCLSSSYGCGQASWSCSQREVTLPIWQVINFHKLHWNIWFFLLVIERYLNVIKHFWVAPICTIDNHARLGFIRQTTKQWNIP